MKVLSTMALAITAVFATYATAQEWPTKAVVNKALAVAEVKTLWAEQGATLGANNPNDMAAFVSAEITKWAKVAKSANIQVD
jgi:hypothetical protein